MGISIQCPNDVLTSVRECVMDFYKTEVFSSVVVVIHEVVMNGWSVEQLVFVTEKYFSCGKSIVVAQREYMKHYGIKKKENVPSRKVISRCVKNFRKSGSVLKTKRHRKRVVRTPENIESVHQNLEEDGEKTIRRISEEENLSYGTVQNILRKDLCLFPYKVQVTQRIDKADLKKRLTFAQWFLDQNQADVNFLSHLIMSDEAHFDLSGYVNKQNCRIWARQNPYAIHERPLHDVRVTVWCGVTMRGIIGPFFFEDENGNCVTVNSDRYKVMLEQFLFPKLKEMKMSRGVWFQQDGATAHTAKQCLTSLRGQFKCRLISRLGDVPWPPRSPDLTVPDYYLWGYLKDNVYRNKPKTVHGLKGSLLI